MHNKIIEVKNKFIREISRFYNIAESPNITFEGIAYHILNNTDNILEVLQQTFPKNIKDKLIQDYNYYLKSNKKEEKVLALYNYILRFQEIFDERENEFIKQNKKIKIITQDMQNEQKKLLFEYYSIISNQNECPPPPDIMRSYQRKLKSLKNDKDNKEIKSYEKFLIIGHHIKPVDKNEKQKIENIDLKLNLKIDNSIPIQLPEIDLIKYQKNLSLNNIFELYNKLIIGSRIFPAYLYTAIINKNQEKLDYSSKYFDILYSIYLNVIKSTSNNSLIFSKLNEFIFSFEDMIIKLKNAGVTMTHNNKLESIKKESYNQNSFETQPKKIEPTRRNDEWDEKIFKKKEQQNYQNNPFISIYPSNMKSEII